MSRWRAGTQATGEPIGLPPLVETPDIPVRARRTMRAWLTLWLVRPWWLWRREVMAVVFVASCAVTGYAFSGWLGAGLVPAGVVGLLLAVPESRWTLWRLFQRGRLRRHWDRACRFAGLSTSNDRVPRIKKESHLPVGERLVVRMPRGLNPYDLIAVTDSLASELAVREVRAARDVEKANLARVTIVRRDPFADRAAEAWPWLHETQVSLWDAVPLMADENGDHVHVTVIGKNVLVAGEPESGKSVGLAELLAAASLAGRSVRIWGLDAKRVELALWRPVMFRLEYGDIDRAIGMLEDLIEVMDQIYEGLEAAGLRKVPDGHPLEVLVVDELRFFTAHANARKREKFNGLLIDVVARGRAAGVICFLATQKPSSDVVPTSLRDLVGYRWAMRCTTRDASDTILGAGWATLGFSAATIPVATRGVGLLLAEGSPEPIRGRSFYLTDDDIRMIAARGAALRSGL